MSQLEVGKGMFEVQNDRIHQIPKNPEEQVPASFAVCVAKKVTLSSIVCLKHKVLGSVAREKIGGTDRINKPGYERPHVL